jgi:ferredoxin, 2Fe-2S
VKLNVKDRAGSVREVSGEVGDTLMRILRDQDFDVAGTCGGECSCGTCHVYVSGQAWASLPASSEEESDMLLSLADVIEVTPESRLSCQITLTADMDGASLEVGPQL